MSMDEANSEDEATFHLDFRFIGVEDELWALGEYLEVIEQQMTLLATKQSQNSREKGKAQGYNDDDPEMENIEYMAYHFANDALPRLIRGPFLVTVWAVFESSVNDVAAYIQQKQSKALSLRDLRGDNTLDRARKYFEHVLEFPLVLDSSAWEKLTTIATLRNILAHANGRLASAKLGTEPRIHKLVTANPDIAIVDNNLVLSAQFLQDAYETVNQSLRDLTQRVRSSF
jgi:hypothetical protein